MFWYKLDGTAVAKKLDTSESGLTNSQVRERLAKYGPNTLTEEAKINLLQVIFHQFSSPLIYILLIAAFVTLLLGEYADTGVIAAVVFLNAVIGFSQEYKAEQSVRALKSLLVSKARALRNGYEMEIPSTELVPGDIVVLSSGVRVPADLRLLHAIELRIDEALLTGESLPAEKGIAPLVEDNLIPGDQTNMAFMGTSVVKGRARGVVVSTGDTTLLGSIAGQVRKIGIVKTPIQEKIERFARSIGIIVLAASALLFAVGIALRESAKDMFMTAVAAAVATIPEGLPIVVTIALAVGVSRMAKNNAIIRRLPAVETLGSTTVICSDKTGTLTKNEMTVKLLFDGTDVLEMTGSGYEPVGELLRDGRPIANAGAEPLRLLLRIGLLCNESDIYEEQGSYRVDGDPTEGALIVAARKGGLRIEEERASWEQEAIIPFESERGFMATLHRHEGRQIAFIKGAPERVLEMCRLDAGERESILRTADRFAEGGLRVLAFAWKEVESERIDFDHHVIAEGLSFAGLQGMIDPPRPEVIEAIRGCKQAGIRVVMITGDHAVTARSIAQQLGITSAEAEVITGRDLEEMSDDELFAKVREVSVYARVSPDHKLRITRQLIRRGEIVAMTGDGVNDAPALKAAHIGIAMGKSGTDVAKEAADMVLTDDNFASIFAAVREGRVVFDNLRKVIFFLIPTGIAAILSIIGAMLLGVPIPYVPAQLLWINLVTNGLQDVAMSFEPGEKGILGCPPRDPSEGLLSRLLIQRTILVGTLIAAGVLYTYTTALNNGASLDNARTVAVTTMVFFQFFQAWNSRSEHETIFRINPLSNPFLFYALIAALFAQLAFIYAPPLQWIFRTVPLTTAEWIQIIGCATTVIVAVEIDKWLRRFHRGCRQSGRDVSGGTL